MKNNYIITEGIEGYYYYHLSHKTSPTKSLCGKNVMKTYLPLCCWGITKSHLNERYCPQCQLESNK